MSEQAQKRRREFFLRIAQGVAGGCAGGVIWAHWLGQEARAMPFALRPPGALPERDFNAKCIKCGQCVVACPYDTLRLAAPGEPIPIGTPYFKPRETPCYLCEDIPCKSACPSGALGADFSEIEEAEMGLAVLVDQEHCLSWRGLRCEICYRECPLSGDAIRVENHPRKSSKHALFVPVVVSDHCTGCGICEKACPLPESTIKVLPKPLAQGRIGDHYRLGWTVESPITQEFEPAEAAPVAEDAVQQGLDYLNSDNLF